MNEHCYRHLHRLKTDTCLGSAIRSTDSSNLRRPFLWGGLEMNEHCYRHLHRYIRTHVWVPLPCRPKAELEEKLLTTCFISVNHDFHNANILIANVPCCSYPIKCARTTIPLVIAFAQTAHGCFDQRVVCDGRLPRRGRTTMVSTFS